MKGIHINNGQGNGGNVAVLGGSFVIDDGEYVSGGLPASMFMLDDGVYQP